MVKSLVTGGAGFIGSQLVRTLLDHGHDVRVLDNFSTGKLENLDGVQSRIQLLEGDIRSREDVGKAVESVDLLFHQAAFVSVPLSMAQPERCFEINVAGTNNVLQRAREAGVRRVVLASSAAVYGNNQRLPLHEGKATMALSPYAASKRTNEVYGDLYTRAFGLEVVSLRYFNVYGPRQSPESDYAAVIPSFLSRVQDGLPPVIHGDGTQGRDFIYVGDVARANLLAAQARGAAGKVINICTGETTTILSLSEKVLEVAGSNLEPVFTDERPGDIEQSVGDPQQGREILDFHPQVTLSEGLRQTLAWMNDD